MTVGTGKFISRKVSKVRWLPQTDTSQLESFILVNTILASYWPLIGQLSPHSCSDWLILPR